MEALNRYDITKSVKRCQSVRPLEEKMTNPKQQIYHAFLLRCWLSQPVLAGEVPAWRFELRDIAHEPQKHGFSNLEQLRNFLSDSLERIAADSHKESGRAENPPGGTV